MLSASQTPGSGTSFQGTVGQNSNAHAEQGPLTSLGDTGAMASVAGESFRDMGLKHPDATVYIAETVQADIAALRKRSREVDAELILLLRGSIAKKRDRPEWAYDVTVSHGLAPEMVFGDTLIIAAARTEHAGDPKWHEVVISAADDMCPVPLNEMVGQPVRRALVRISNRFVRRTLRKKFDRLQAHFYRKSGDTLTRISAREASESTAAIVYGPTTGALVRLASPTAAEFKRLRREGVIGFLHTHPFWRPPDAPRFFSVEDLVAARDLKKKWRFPRFLAGVSDGTGEHYVLL